MVFLLRKSPEVTYGLLKTFNEPKNDTKNHHFVCKTVENERNFSDKITSARAITSCYRGKYKNPNASEDWFKTTSSRISKHF